MAIEDLIIQSCGCIEERDPAQESSVLIVHCDAHWAEIRAELGLDEGT